MSGGKVQWQALNNFANKAVLCPSHKLKYKTHAYFSFGEILFIFNFLDRGHNIYGNDFLLSMQLQTTSTEATMALGGTAVELEQSLNFYAGWRKYFIIQIFCT